MRLGGIFGGAGEAQLNALTKYGEKIGLAFQIIDDILDVEGKFEKTGKRVGKDAALGKATYPSLMGLEEARHKAKELCEGAMLLAEELGPAAEPLWLLADYVHKRQE